MRKLEHFNNIKIQRYLQQRLSFLLCLRIFLLIYYIYKHWEILPQHCINPTKHDSFLNSMDGGERVLSALEFNNTWITHLYLHCVFTLSSSIVQTLEKGECTNHNEEGWRILTHSYDSFWRAVTLPTLQGISYNEIHVKLL